ncbi:MAG: S41 family peptidase, partial [Bauldia sp.]
MIRKTTYLLVGALVGAVGAVSLTQSHLLTGGSASAAGVDTYRQLNLFGDVFERIRAKYVEVPDEGALIEAAINGMLTSLDPHSSYMNAKAYDDMQVQTQGEFGGLGIEVTMEDGLVKVVYPIEDTPAARGGVLAGDLITALDGEAVQGMALDQAVDKMRGAINTPITLTIQRAGSDKPIEIKLVREKITIQSVTSREEGDVGYIKIKSFNEQTFDGLKSSMAKIQKDIPTDKLKGYVIDLRNNPGGLLDQAIAVSD